MMSDVLARRGARRRSAMIVVAALEVVQLGACEAGARRGQGVAGASSADVIARDDAGVPPVPETAMRVVSRDASGRPRLVLGDRVPGRAHDVKAFSREQLARAQLARVTRARELLHPGSRTTPLQASHKLGRGAELLQFAQYAHGVPVFGAQAKVLFDAQQQLVSLATQLSAADRGAAKYRAFAWCSASQAVAWAYQAHAAVALPASAIRAGAEHAGWQALSVVTPADLPEVRHATAERVLFPEASALVPAYHVELVLRAAHGGGVNHGVSDVLSADDGRVLYSAELTAHDAFTYRVWADADGVPTDGPMQDATPYPRAQPDARPLAPAQPQRIAIEGFNHNPAGRADPWLMPSDRFTFGNNVRAYSDRNQTSTRFGLPEHDGFDAGEDVRADVTSDRTFDRSYDLSRAPDADADQIKASVTQLFYVTNWLHDYWYDSGFDELSKNAQQSNFGRGGLEGDPLRAEAQDSADSGASNNANMTTLSDGRSPCMQMYVWSGAPNRSFVTEPPVSLHDGLGAMSVDGQTFDLGAERLALVSAGDDSGSGSDACQTPSHVAGKIAVVDRGVCTFDVKLENLRAAGARGAVFVDDVPGHGVVNPAVSASAGQLPALSISYEDGMTLKAALAGSPLTAAQFRRGPEPLRDGTIDNTIVAHEWGHYLHHRLVSCGSQTCRGMSEGWADFVALLLMIRAPDTFEGKVYPLAQYAAGGLNPRAVYFGIRRAPYATDLDKNPFTFEHIQKSSVLPTGAPLAATSADMSEAHNVGEVWAQMLFEGYANLIEAGRAAGRSFEQSRRHMADYVVAGMKAAPVEPSFIEQRDALLAAVHAIAVDDSSRSGEFAALARAFAKRGLGIGAIAPDTSSRTLDGAVPSFAFEAELALSAVSLDDSLVSCDHDGQLDAGEAGVLQLTIANRGWAPLSTRSVQIVSTDPALKVAALASPPLPDELQPYDSISLRFAALVDPRQQQSGIARLMLSSSAAIRMNADAQLPIALRYNFDDVPGSATVDDVESVFAAWTVASASGPVAWSRTGSADNHVWHADDASVPSDQSLVSPELVVSEERPLIFSFKQRYSFERGAAVTDGPDVGFDGGVIEISRDGGITYRDIAKYVDPGYTGEIFSTRGLRGQAADTNALAGRKAFIGNSPDYPAFTRVSLDLGKQFAGKTIKLRFRIATDEGTSAAGWDLDDFAFGTADAPSLVNRPFAALHADAGSCRIAAPITRPAPTAP